MLKMEKLIVMMLQLQDVYTPYILLLVAQNLESLVVLKHCGAGSLFSGPDKLLKAPSGECGRP
jgi:hypothetical protein